MLINWKIDYVDFKPAEKQAANYYVYGEPYWFFNIWLLDKAKFIPYGTDYSSIGKIEYEKINATEPYIICVDGGWRDRKTLIEGYEKN